MLNKLVLQWFAFYLTNNKKKILGRSYITVFLKVEVEKQAKPQEEWEMPAHDGRYSKDLVSPQR